ncbi:acyltransferase [uncultured Neptuniibacter sp.]|uniref:acyltransferase n=1 Tax=uncultured Neptuniibacter sp. TaxID=502143 RepID=UPI00260A9994|nr:acyltransferase [uncultured Neptuniibacter sp.]
MNTDKIVKLIRYVSGIPKSIYVNFRLLPFRQALHLPILVSRKTKLKSLSGRAHITQIKTGIVRIGFGGIDMLDYRYDRPVLQIKGDIHFKGKAKIGIGAKLLVDGTLYLGNNINITGDALLICAKKISIGDDVMIAWRSTLMDTDQHAIFNKNREQINPDQEIIVGDNVWIGSQSLILKGSDIKDGCIIGANTTITKSFNTENAVIAGVPAKVLKADVTWQH